MKKFLALILAAFLAVATLAACTSSSDPPPPPPATGGETTGGETTGGDTTGGDDVTTPPAGGGAGTINFYSFTDELPNMSTAFSEHFPDFGYSFNTTIIATDGGGYQTSLDQALSAGGASAPDMYAAESAFVLKYSQGDASSFAKTYADLGIADVNGKIASAQIAQYAVDLGTRGGDVVALPFQATGSAFIYRRSIATEVFGSDDAATVEAAIGAGSGNWDKFYTAADALVAAGYKIVPGYQDVWKPVFNSSDTPWVVGNALVIDPKREAFLDIAKTLVDNAYINQFADWSEGWFGDMGGVGDTPAFGFLGPAWLINYVMAGNAGDTYGDWNVCAPPVGFMWGGTWLFANNGLNADVQDGVRQFVEWVTLDTSDTGLQYHWANGTLFIGTSLDSNDGQPGTKDTVASGVVMAKSDGTVEFLGGADMFPAFIAGNDYARGDNASQYDEDINQLWIDQVGQYTEGNKDRDTAIADFKQTVADNFGLDI